VKGDLARESGRFGEGELAKNEQNVYLYIAKSIELWALSKEGNSKHRECG
jgi:hypothetical protein